MKQDEWLEKLSPELYALLRNRDESQTTDYAYDANRLGMYHCSGCSAKLFSSKRSFDTNDNRISFDKPVVPEAIHVALQKSPLPMTTIVQCNECQAYLGKLFMQGPRELPGGLAGVGMTFSINPLALEFVPAAV